MTIEAVSRPLSEPGWIATCPADLDRLVGQTAILCPALHRLPLRTAHCLACLPICSANELLLDTLRAFEVRTFSEPLFAGVFAVDPMQSVDRLLRDLHSNGIRGVANFPSTSIFSKNFSQTLSRTKLGFECEVDFIAIARAAGLSTAGFFNSIGQGRALLEAGADVLIAQTIPFSSQDTLEHVGQLLYTLLPDAVSRNVPLRLYEPLSRTEMIQLANEYANGVVLCLGEAE